MATSIRHLAGRVTNNFFAIDGTTVTTTNIYDGTNIAAINSELKSLLVNDRYFEIVEAGGAQTLHLRAIPEPSTFAILGSAVSLAFTRRRR